MSRAAPFRLPGLLHLQCFEAAARHQSFTSAGEEVGLTQSAVSKKVRELEIEMGFALFQRVGRGVILTPAGRDFAQQLAPDLTRLDRTVQNAVAGGARKTTLSIGILPTFASLWLIPRLPQFAARHPEVELSFSTRLVPFDFDAEPLDLAFHYGADNWPGTRMLHLFGESVAPVCAPGFRDSHGLKSDLGNLAEVPLLHLSSRSQAWPEWFGLAGLHRSSVREGRYFDQHSMVIAAAIASLGVALVPLQMIGRELQGGDLVRLDGPVLTTGQSYYLVRPAGSMSDPVRAFEDWVREQVAKA